MCSHYTALKKAEQLERYFRARGIPIPKSDMWPRYPGVFVRQPPEWESGDEAVPDREAAQPRPVIGTEMFPELLSQDPWLHT